MPQLGTVTKHDDLPFVHRAPVPLVGGNHGVGGRDMMGAGIGGRMGWVGEGDEAHGVLGALDGVLGPDGITL